MNMIKKLNNKNAELNSMLSYQDGENSIFKLAITSTSSEYDDTSLTQLILNFFEIYREVYMIEIDEISCMRVPRNGFNSDDQDNRLWSVSIGFHPTSEQSTFYSGFFCDFAFEFGKIYVKDDVTKKVFYDYMLNSFSSFTDQLKEELNRSISPEEDNERYYPCRSAKINGIDGYIVESVPNQSRANLIYLLMKLDDGIVYGIRHSGDYRKPTSLEKNVFNYRWGWFISPNKKSPLKLKKKKAEKESISLSQKTLTYTSLPETFNALDILSNLISDNSDENE